MPRDGNVQSSRRFRRTAHTWHQSQRHSQADSIGHLLSYDGVGHFCFRQTAISSPLSCRATTRA
jgi:hypothetical protein